MPDLKEFWKPKPVVKWTDYTQFYGFPSRPAKSTPEPLKVDMSPVKLYNKRLDRWIEGMPDTTVQEIRAYVKSLLVGDNDQAVLDSFNTNLVKLPFSKELYGTPDKYGDVANVLPDWKFNLDVEEQQKKIQKFEQPKSQGDMLDTQTDPLTGRQIPLSQTEAEREMWQRGKAQGYGSIWDVESQLRQRQDLVDRKQAELDRKATEGRTEQLSSALSRPTDAQSEAQQRAQLFQQFEQVRQQKLSNLDPEMDWIQRWFVQHEENPNTPPTPTGEDRLNALGGELQKWKDIANNYPDTPVNVGDSVTWGDVANQSKERIQSMLDTIRDAPPDGGSDSVTARQTAPETPQWLADLVPGLKTGQPIRSNVELPTPSLQQWSRIAPSIQNQYAGFSNWAGTPIKDILARMNLMRPVTPGGTGNIKWNPTRQ